MPSPRDKLEQREWVIWGGPCRICGFLICECPEYRYAEGGSSERLKRAFGLTGKDIDLYGVRMTIDEIKGRCPVCGQGVAGYTSNFNGLGQPESVMVKCNNGHWQPMEDWNKVVPLARPQIPATPREAGEIAAAKAMQEADPRPETATMLQHPEPERDPLAPVTATVSIKTTRSAMELLRADWNPDKNLRVGQLKLVVASLISECEALRDRPRMPDRLGNGEAHVPNVDYNAAVNRGARNAANAITAFETAMMHLEKALRSVKDT